MQVDCVKAMVDVVDIPVTVMTASASTRSRATISRRTLSAPWPRRAVRGVRRACPQRLAQGTFSQGKPRDSAPSLRHRPPPQARVSHLTIAINGGLTTDAGIAEQLEHVDGVMIGREAYHNPWLMAGWDERFYGDAQAVRPTRDEVGRPPWSTIWSAPMRRMGSNWHSIASYSVRATGSIRPASGARSDHRLKPCHPGGSVLARAHRVPATKC